MGASQMCPRTHAEELGLSITTVTLGGRRVGISPSVVQTVDRVTFAPANIRSDVQPGEVRLPAANEVQADSSSGWFCDLPLTSGDLSVITQCAGRPARNRWWKSITMKV